MSQSLPFAAVDDELRQVRASIVQISTRHHVSVVALAGRSIVFTEDELLAAVEPLPQTPRRQSSSASARAPSSDRNAAAGDTRQLVRFSSNVARIGSSAAAAGLGVADFSRDSMDESSNESRRPSSVARHTPSINKADTETAMKLLSRLSIASSPEADLKLNLPSDLSQIFFGVEMETLLLKTSNELFYDNRVKALRDVIPALQGSLDPAEFNVQFFDYDQAKHDVIYDAWKITTDLSIKSDDGRPIFGLEFITPKLNAASRGLPRLRSFTKELVTFGFRTNSTTALHVHVSCENLSNDELRMFSMYAVAYEHIIDLFVAVPRRADYSRYCRSLLKSVSMMRDSVEALNALAKLDLKQSVNPLCELVNPNLSAAKNSQRNHKINYTLLRDTTRGTKSRRLEFRQHQGSIEFEEIAAWVVLVTTFLYRAAKMRSAPSLPCNWDSFWGIVQNKDLEDYYTIKRVTLDIPVEFTYDGRELYLVNENDSVPAITLQAPAAPDQSTSSDLMDDSGSGRRGNVVVTADIASNTGDSTATVSGGSNATASPLRPTPPPIAPPAAPPRPHAPVIASAVPPPATTAAETTAAAAPITTNNLRTIADDEPIRDQTVSVSSDDPVLLALLGMPSDTATAKKKSLTTRPLVPDATTSNQSASQLQPADLNAHSIRLEVEFVDRSVALATLFNHVSRDASSELKVTLRQAGKDDDNEDDRWSLGPPAVTVSYLARTLAGVRLVSPFGKNADATSRVMFRLVQFVADEKVSTQQVSLYVAAGLSQLPLEQEGTFVAAMIFAHDALKSVFDFGTLVNTRTHFDDQIVNSIHGAPTAKDSLKKLVRMEPSHSHTASFLDHLHPISLRDARDRPFTVKFQLGNAGVGDSYRRCICRSSIMPVACSGNVAAAEADAFATKAQVFSAVVQWASNVRAEQLLLMFDELGGARCSLYGRQLATILESDRASAAIVTSASAWDLLRK